MSRKQVLAVALVAGTLGAAGGAAISATGAPTNNDKVLFGVLDGKNEIGPDGRRRAGDLDGKGSATAIIDEGRLCFGLTSKNIATTTGAHIHRGTRGENGPIVVHLTAPSPADPGASSGCVNIAESLAREILRNPRKFYWNIHTTEKPAGAIRGQVTAKRK